MGSSGASVFISASAQHAERSGLETPGNWNGNPGAAVSYSPAQILTLEARSRTRKRRIVSIHEHWPYENAFKGKIGTRVVPRKVRAKEGIKEEPAIIQYKGWCSRKITGILAVRDKNGPSGCKIRLHCADAGGLGRKRTSVAHFSLEVR